MTTTKGWAYRLLRWSNDARAVRRGKVGRRVARRAYGKATGRLARKLLGLLALGAVLAASGCHWLEGYHWRRPDGASTTPVTFVDRTAPHHAALVRYAADVWSRSPEVNITVADDCSGLVVRCVYWYTEQLDGMSGHVRIVTNGGTHLSTATVRLDPDVGAHGLLPAAYVACHEAGGGLGAGYSHHSVCDRDTGAPTAHDYEALAQEYDHSHG